MERQAAKNEDHATRLTALRSKITDAESRLGRLYAAIESGVADLNDQTLKDRVVAVKTERDIAQIAYDRAVAETNPRVRITDEKIAKFVETMRSNVMTGDTPFRRAYIRSVIDQVEVDDDEIRIWGRKGVLERLVAASGGGSPAGVPSFVRKWSRPMRFELLASELLIRLCSISRCSLRARARQLDRKKRPNRPSSDASSQRGRLADRQPPPCPRSRVQAPFPPHLGDSLCIRSPNLERLSGSHAGLPQHPFGELPL
jgi:hypothetical protein